MIRVSDAASKKELKVGNWMEREWLLGLENNCDNNKSARNRKQMLQTDRQIR